MSNKTNKEQTAEELAEAHSIKAAGSTNAKDYPVAFVSAIKIRAKRSYLVGYNAAIRLSAHCKEKEEWVRVEDRLPEEGGRYLCYVSELNDLGTSRFVWNCYYDYMDNQFRDSHQVMRVTHWRPLPHPPIN